jgi:hypothetical protein
MDDEQETKLQRLAGIVIDKHGDQAPEVARERARECLDRRDYEAAKVWLEVAEMAGRDGPT